MLLSFSVLNTDWRSYSERLFQRRRAGQGTLQEFGGLVLATTVWTDRNRDLYWFGAGERVVDVPGIILVPRIRALNYGLCSHSRAVASPTGLTCVSN